MAFSNKSYKLQASISVLKNRLLGWKTNRKILVIESDDWGAIRTSSTNSFQELLNMGYDLDKSCYNLDGLEKDEDLELLFETLTAFKDKTGRPCCFTSNVVVANPDFDRIRKENIKRYFYESVKDSLNTYKKSGKVVDLWNQGLAARVFIPQMHCREHIRYWDWFEDLRSGKQEVVDTFKFNMCGLPAATSLTNTSYYRTPYMHAEALKREQIKMSELIDPAFTIFRELFGYTPASVVAPNVGWSDETEKCWLSNGIKYIQGGKVQVVDDGDNKNYFPHYLGEQNSLSQLYLVRNCTFEPAKQDKHNAARALIEIERAFAQKQPAIISTHRVNYTSRVSQENRDESLKQLKTLLKEVTKRWPDIEFLSSAELGDVIRNGQSDFENSIKGS